MIQIRNVPEEMHAELKARAAREGMSLSDFLKRELSNLLEQKSLAEVFEEMEPYRIDIQHDVIVDAIIADKRDHRGRT
jgi:plasmid stability protein